MRRQDWTVAFTWNPRRWFLHAGRFAPYSVNWWLCVIGPLRVMYMPIRSQAYIAERRAREA